MKEEEEGSEVFLNCNPSGLLMLHCSMPQSVTQSVTASPSRAQACKHDPMQYLHHLSAMGLQGNTQREMQEGGWREMGEEVFCQRSLRTPCAAVLLC